MSDMVGEGPDFTCLFQTADGQHGYFTTAQAQECGYRANLLTYYVRTGTFKRVYRGVYRLRDFPPSPREEVMAAWLAVGKERAVVSHESALDLLGLSDVIPNNIHLTVPRSVRNLPKQPGVIAHTTTKPLGSADLTLREGIRVTSFERTILDVAEVGVAPEQVQHAVVEALGQGLTTRAQLEQAARERSQRVYRLIVDSFEGAPS
jgi:predicted transcriptional regulator of viral defense system